MSRISAKRALFVAPHVVEELALELADVGHRHVVELAAGAEPDRDHLLLDRERRVLRLLEQLDEAAAAAERGGRRGVEVGAERGERLQLAVLRQVQPQRAGDRAHRPHLRGATDARHRDADVDGRSHALVEQVGLQEDLAVGDRDDVGGDVGRHVVGLGLDDRQTGHRARAELVGELRAALQQPGVQVEDVAGVGLAARRAAQQQRDRPVGLGLLRQVVEDDQDVLARVHPVLADRRAGVGGEPLEARGVGRRGGDDRRVLQCARVFQRRADACDRRPLLTDRDVDAAHLLLGVVGRPVALLVDDRVHADGGLAGLAVTDDQLALAAADRGHGVDGLDAGLQGLGHRLALHHRGRLHLQHAAFLGLDVAEAVDRSPERVDHAAEEGVADRHREDLAGAPHLLPLLDAVVRAEDDRADVALVEVQRDTEDATLELQQLVRHGRGKTLDVRDAVTGVEDGADLFPRRPRLQGGDVARNRAPDLI